MEKTFVVRGTNLTIHMPKELDHHHAEEIKKEADHLLETRNIRSIIFDFEKTSFMDSSGIAVVMRVRQRVRDLGGAVTLRGVRPQARKVLDAAGLDRFVTVE